MVTQLMERPKYCVTKVLPVDIDYSFTSLSSVLKLPITSTTEQEEGGAFAGASVHLTTVEINDLRIKGFRSFEIDNAIKRLQERTVSISHNTVLAELEQTNQSIKDDVWTKVEEIIGQSAGILGKKELFHWLEARVRSHERSALRLELDYHYASLWPSKATIVSLVGKWPKQYKSEAIAIKRMWPELTINGDINVDFASTTRELCSNCYYDGPDNEVLSYPTFFKLVKDIWFNAIECGHTGHLNRVTHLLIYIIKEIANNYFAYKNSSRDKRHESVIHNQLEFGVTAVNDIGALAFFLVTHPKMWKLNKAAVFQEMINRVLMSEVEELAGYYCQWLDERPGRESVSTEKTAQVIEQIAKKMESQQLSTVTKAMYYLDAIDAYIEKNKSKFADEKRVKQISRGNYFDDVTWQINGPMFSPEGTDREVVKRIVTALNKVFTTPDYQHLFMGTPEYQSLQNRKKWQQVIGKIKKSNWDKKNAAARITIDATLRKVRAVRVIERRLSRLASQVMVDIAERESKQRTKVKQQFYQTGFEPQIDPEDQSIFYPAPYYLLRKQAFAKLKQFKLDVESVIGTTIPFRASRSQIDHVLRCFHQLPVEESRYWQMSRDFAKYKVLPELVQDLSLSKPANTHQELQERQRKFIICKCLTCTICNVDAYLCRCDTGIGKKLSARFSVYKRRGLANSVEKNVQNFVAEKFCTKPFDRYIPRQSTDQADESSRGNTVSSVRSGSLKRKISESQEESISDDFMDYFSDDVVTEDSDSSSSVSWGADSVKLNAHLGSDGELCRKPHSRRPFLIVQHMTNKIVCRVMRKRAVKSGDTKALWQAEAVGESAARHFYQSVGVPKCVINRKNVSEWFSGHPGCKKKAVESLEKYPGIKHLVDKESLEFHPKSFKKIQCQVVYHDLDMFQEHLGRLGFNAKAPRLPINKSDNGLYLHKTFCLCCRINFGQPKELKEHLKVHDKKMVAAFARIKASPLSAPVSTENNSGLSFDAENNSLAESRLRLQQRDLHVQMEKLFKEMTA